MVTCSIVGCGRSTLARGWCGKHYQRWRKYGDPNQVAVIIGDLPARLSLYTQKSDNPDACWPWTGYTDKDGYGVIQVSGKARRATRVLWELTFPDDAPLPREVLVCHRCDNPPCMRLSHLWLGSNDANMADCTAKGRRPRGLRAGVHTKPDSRVFGERHPNARLSREQAAEIARRRASGEKRIRLAEEFGVSEQHVWQIICGNTWHTRIPEETR